MESSNASRSADEHIEHHTGDDMIYQLTAPSSTSELQQVKQREVGFEPGRLDWVVDCGAEPAGGLACMASLRGGDIDEAFGSERGRLRIEECGDYEVTDDVSMESIERNDDGRRRRGQGSSASATSSSHPGRLLDDTSRSTMKRNYYPGTGARSRSRSPNRGRSIASDHSAYRSRSPASAASSSRPGRFPESEGAQYTKERNHYDYVQIGTRSRSRSRSPDSGRNNASDRSTYRSRSRSAGVERNRQSPYEGLSSDVHSYINGEMPLEADDSSGNSSLDSAGSQADTTDVSEAESSSEADILESGTPDSSSAEEEGAESRKIREDLANKSDKPPRAKYPQPMTDNPLPPSDLERFKVFTNFCALPFDIRVKIWGAMLPGPQVILVTYDTNVRYCGAKGYLDYDTDHCKWILKKSVQRIAARQICQESRAIAKLGGHERVHLNRDYRQNFWLNFDTDKIFLNTNAQAGTMARSFIRLDYEHVFWKLAPESPIEEDDDNEEDDDSEEDGDIKKADDTDEDDNIEANRSIKKKERLTYMGDSDGFGVYQVANQYKTTDGYTYTGSARFYEEDKDDHERTLVLPPIHNPIGNLLSRLKHLVVDEGLWFDWKFSEFYSSFVRDRWSAGFGDDTSQEKWKRILIAKSSNLETVSIVKNSTGFEDLTYKKFKFIPDLDPPQLPQLPTPEEETEEDELDDSDKWENYLEEEDDSDFEMYEDDAMDEDEEVDEEMYTMEERDVIRRAVQERWEALDALEARRLKLKRKQERRFRLKMDFMKVEIEPIV